jgi:hypothetical protein
VTNRFSPGAQGLLILLSCLFFITACRSEPQETAPVPVETPELSEETVPEHIVIPPDLTELPASAFGEIWAYVVAGREEALRQGLPLSDIGYFGAEVSAYGQLVEIPSRRKLAAFSGRVHLVVTCPGYGLSHFIVSEGAPRRRIIAELLEAAKPYDGLQIDFESIPKLDGDSFCSFLEDLRKGLGEKIFTIALPARIRTLTGDPYNYHKIAPLVDRILVMAYDEHWSTSTPGPVASMNWCKSVAAYALDVIGEEKLIMGIPFYGRAWEDPSPAGAKIYATTERIRQEQGIRDIRRENGIPLFTYEVPVTVTLYYEDDYSLSTRMDMYRSMGVRSVGFWRLGQESPGVWELLSLSAGNGG